MALQEQFDKEAMQSADSRKQLRESRRTNREAKQGMMKKLRAASSTQERRAIKDAFKGIGLNTGKSSSGGSAKGSVYDVSTENPNPKNNQGYDSKISDDSIDSIVAEGGGGGGDGEPIDVVWCVNGNPYSGTVVGTIGDPL